MLESVGRALRTHAQTRAHNDDDDVPMLHCYYLASPHQHAKMRTALLRDRRSREDLSEIRESKRTHREAWEYFFQTTALL